jgi:hypothetical protein
VATATWCNDRDSAIFPEFFSDAVAIELPEVSWRDIESLAGESEEVSAEHDALPATEETEEQKEERTAAEREYLVRQRHYADLDAQLSCVITDDNPFSVSPTMAREVKAFRTVVTSYCTIRNRSGVAVSRYSGEGHGTRKSYKPIHSDFLCDVELAAKKVLTRNLHRVFQKCIVEETGEKWAGVPVNVRNAIEAKVGHAFSRAGMFPVARYFA